MNKKWFDRVVNRAAALAPTSDAQIDRVLRRVPRRPQMVYFLVYGFAEVIRQPLRMFRPDPDPEIERLRQEAVARYMPMLYMFGAGVVLWFVALVVAVIVTIVRLALY